MKNLVVVMDNELRVSHREIAGHTDNKEVSIRNIINKHFADFEEFGKVHFKNEALESSKTGQKIKTYYLNEQQATLLLTYLRNSEFVRKFKKALVKEFFAMREQLNKNYKGKNIEHIISGYKSQIAQKNKLIQELQAKVKLLENTKQKQNTKQPALPYKPFGRSTLVELIGAIQREQQDLDNIICTLVGHYKVVGERLNGLLKVYPDINPHSQSSGRVGEFVELKI